MSPIVLLYAGLLLGLVGLVASRTGPARLAQIVPGVAWLGLIVGFGIQAAMPVEELGFAFGTALFAALAVGTGGTKRSERDALGGASAVAVIGGFVGLIAVPAQPVMTTGHLILLSGLLFALFALTGGLVAAATARTSYSGAGAAVAAAGALACSSVVAHLRSSLPQSGYSIPLRTAEGDPIYWTLPGVENLTDGLRMAAVLDVPSMPWIVAAGVLAAVGAIVSGSLRKKKAEIGAWILVGAAALAALGVLHVASTEARLPAAQRYQDVTRQVLKEAEAAETNVERAAFSTPDGSAVVISRRDMAPEFFGFGLAFLLALLVLSRRVGPFSRDEEASHTGHAERLARDQMVRACAFGWLTVLASGLVHLGYFGVAWLGTASEWTAFGALFIATGLAISVFQPARNPASRAAAALAPGLAVAVVLLVAALAYGFGAPFGLSINAF